LSLSRFDFRSLQVVQ